LIFTFERSRKRDGGGKTDKIKTENYRAVDEAHTGYLIVFDILCILFGAAGEVTKHGDKRTLVEKQEPF